MVKVAEKMHMNEIKFHMDEIIYGLRYEFKHHHGYFKVVHFTDFEDIYNEINALIDDDETID